MYAIQGFALARSWFEVRRDLAFSENTFLAWPRYYNCHNQMIAFFLLLLSALAAPALVRGFIAAFRYLRKKQKPEAKQLLCEAGIEAVINLIVCLVVSLFAIVFFHEMKPWSAFCLYFSISMLLSLLRCGSWIYARIKGTPIPREKAIGAGVVLGGLLLYLAFDGFFMNRAARNSQATQTNIALNDTSYVASRHGFAVNDDGSWAAASSSPWFVVRNIPEGAKTVTFDFAPTNSQMELVVQVPNGNDWKRVAAYDVSPLYESYCSVALKESSSSYRFIFNLETSRSTTDLNLTLRKLSINAPIPLDFGVWRFWGVACIGYAIYCLPKLAKKAQTAPTKAKAAKLTLLAGVGAALIALLIVGLCTKRGIDRLFAEGDMSEDQFLKYDIYVKLFDAFRKGQLNLDVTPDPKLIELGSDVYIPEKRGAAGATYLWDYAFYDGKYYCYFGAAPVILVSFPTYWITGSIPTGLYLQFVAFILSVGAMVYLAIILTQLFSFSPNPFFYGLLVLMICFGGLFFNIVVFKVEDYKYRVAVDYALLGALLFLCFCLEAYRGYNAKLMLGFAGFAFVSVMGSRPDFGLWLLFVLPLLLFMFFDKRHPWKKRLLDFTPMAAVLAVGAALLISYNVARYGKPLEFGQSYQLTAFDTRTFKFSFDAFGGAFAHFWAQTPANRQIFGFIDTQFSSTAFDYHPYRAGTIGLLFSPATYLLLFLPVAFACEKRWHWRISFILMPITVFLISWSVYSLGGTCFRYMLTVFPLMSVIGLIGFARFASAPLHHQARLMGYGFALVIAVGAFWFGSNLVSVPFDGMRGEDLNGWFYYWLRDILGARNV